MEGFASEGACPPATRKGRVQSGGGVQVRKEGGRCIGGGLAAGGCAGEDKMGRGLAVRERMGVGLPWGVSAGEGHVWIRGGMGTSRRGEAAREMGCQPRPPRGPNT